MKQYLELGEHILTNGKLKKNRTDKDAISVFGWQSRYDLSETHPTVTTKKMFNKSILSELLWFIEGSNNERRLAEILHGTKDDSKTTIWTQNSESDYWLKNPYYNGEKGHLGRIYGVQWRSWQDPNGNSIDQLKRVINQIKHDPDSRRIIVSAWNVGELDQMALPPCHIFFQFYVSEGKLSCQLYQRSADYFLGVPFNIASYSTFIRMIAQICNLKAGEFIHTIGDAHIYVDHIEQVKLQLTREPLPLPKLLINPEVKNIDDFKMEDFVIEGYQHHPHIPGDMTV